MKRTMTSQDKRKTRVRRSLRSSVERPRLTVFRSNKHIYAQIINDVEAKTLVSASTQSKELEASLKSKSTSDMDAATQVGKLLAEKALKSDIKNVLFDRGPYLYHGRVKALADAAREAGLTF
jgi:large subunit ribosomal protein L18